VPPAAVDRQLRHPREAGEQHHEQRDALPARGKQTRDLAEEPGGEPERRGQQERGDKRDEEQEHVLAAEAVRDELHGHPSCGGKQEDRGDDEDHLDKEQHSGRGEQ